MFLFLNVKKKIEDLDLKRMLQTLGIIDLFLKKNQQIEKLALYITCIGILNQCEQKHGMQEPCLPNNEL